MIATAHPHPHSLMAAKTHDRDKARADRRLICEFIALAGASGASDEDLEQALVVTGKVLANSLRFRRGELQLRLRADGYHGHGFITDILGEVGTSIHGKQITKYHITSKGLEALGMPADSFCVDARVEQ